MADVNGAYKHGSYERICSKRLTSDVKVFATQNGLNGGQTKARRTNPTDFLDPYVTHTDQKQM